jgi:hypothetical protein
MLDSIKEDILGELRKRTFFRSNKGRMNLGREKLEGKSKG